MSQQEAIEREVRRQHEQNPQLRKVEVHEVKDRWTQETINNEIERRRREAESR